MSDDFLTFIVLMNAILIWLMFLTNSEIIKKILSFEVILIAPLMLAGYFGLLGH